jgi:D-glycero-D-manno-heptose 1,7-bisphosphate phosphatase
VGSGPRLSGRRAVFFDRDGVLNRALVRDGKPYPPANLAELEITAGAAVALAKLKERGFLLLVVTNQPDVSRGTQNIEAVEEIHRAIAKELPLDEFLVCPHDDRDGCACRKPKPGLLHDAAARYGVDLANSYLVGDRWRDVEAGQAAGCRTVWIDAGYRERGPTVPPDVKVHSLSEAADWILRNEWHN